MNRLVQKELSLAVPLNRREKRQPAITLNTSAALKLEMVHLCATTKKFAST